MNCAKHAKPWRQWHHDEYLHTATLPAHTALEDTGLHRRLRTHARLAVRRVGHALGMERAMNQAHGYAVISDGAIQVPTISDTKRAAIVNWLCSRVGILMLNSASDDEIFETWKNLSAEHKGVLVSVLITEEE